jgi:hypothetical protein
MNKDINYLSETKNLDSTLSVSPRKLSKMKSPLRLTYI